MSQASELLAEGFNVLTEKAGETLTFRGAPLLAVVDDNVEAKRNKPYDAAQSFGAQTLSIVEFWETAVASVVQVGEAFKDAAGNFHRVTAFRRRGGKYFCSCVVSRSP